MSLLSEVKYLSTASFPVLKLKSSESFECVKIDITFQDHNGEKCVFLISEYEMMYESFVPITIVLKQILFLTGLNDPYSVS